MAFSTYPVISACNADQPSCVGVRLSDDRQTVSITNTEGLEGEIILTIGAFQAFTNVLKGDGLATQAIHFIKVGNDCWHLVSGLNSIVFNDLEVKEFVAGVKADKFSYEKLSYEKLATPAFV